MKPGGKINSSMDIPSDPNKFDLRTHYWDATGKLVKRDPYVLYVRDGVQYYERPVGSGNLWFENNQPAGRMSRKTHPDGKSHKQFDHAATHIEFTEPLSGEQEMHYELELERMQNAELKRELDAIKAEREPKVATPAPAVKGKA